MAAVDAEMAWLEGTGTEPPWPTFPKKNIRPRRRLRLPMVYLDDEQPPGTEDLHPEEKVYHQSAALWLRQVQGLGNADTCPWLRDVVTAYMFWTIAANGGDLGDGEEAVNTPSQWNEVFFALAARCTVGLTQVQVADLLTTPIASLPEQIYFDVLADFLRSFDLIFFEGGTVDSSVALAVRSVFADGQFHIQGRADAYDYQCPSQSRRTSYLP